MTTRVSVVLINKNEPAIAETIEAVKEHETRHEVEIVVVDASSRRFDGLKAAHPDVQWIDFPPIPGVTTIPHQRNAGVRAATSDVIAFTDASCLPQPGWLDRLVAPIVEGHERVCAGATVGRGEGTLYTPKDTEYLEECPTINLAFTREVYDEVGGFDESYKYGSDVDFSWRLRRAGARIRNVPDAVVSHDWGSSQRQLKRAFQYGEARARLYWNHPDHIRTGLRRDPVVFAYPAFLLALPLALSRRFRWIPLLVTVPLWRNRETKPVLTLLDHLSYGAGALSFIWHRLRHRG